MNNKKIVEIFSKSLGISEEIICDSLEYNSIPEWDSIAHMTLISELEDGFDIMLDTDDIIEMSSVSKAKDILGKHNISF